MSPASRNSSLRIRLRGELPAKLPHHPPELGIGTRPRAASNVVSLAERRACGRRPSFSMFELRADAEELAEVHVCARLTEERLPCRECGSSRLEGPLTVEETCHEGEGGALGATIVH